MLKLNLACCKVYISESRNKAALELIEQASKHFSGVSLVNKFQDEAYNRVGYTLVSNVAPTQSANSPSCLGKAVFFMVEAAFKAINFELHCGTHPRLGIVDHICVHPLAQTPLEQAACIAKSLAADIGSNLHVPTYLYGAAHQEGRTLDSVRRKLGYFKPNLDGTQWKGGPTSNLLPLKPDGGPSQAVQSKGVVVVGATRWVDNYNVPISSTDMSVARRIARRVSGRGGGIQSVQAMALAHGEGVIEVACNLLDPNVVGADQVQLKVEELAGEEGITVGRGYYTDFSQEKIVEEFMKSETLV
ncbi:hypothetical protein Scep_011159 [Stephania cephalantha]|uniref:glutamate formimidoyltransferase n=1 Tax=Stephania cephalantha TaxID=152367 RepID=A0AAP0JCK4_9MAGN